jgi:hypothetical protein
MLQSERQRGRGSLASSKLFERDDKLINKKTAPGATVCKQGIMEFIFMKCI